MGIGGKNELYPYWGADSSIGSKGYVYKAPVQMGPKMQFTKDVFSILKELNDTVHDPVAFEIAWMSQPNAKYDNSKGVTLLDLSDKDGCFNIVIKGTEKWIKIDNFLKTFITKNFTDSEIKTFTNRYNKCKKGQSLLGDAIVVPKFRYNPKDVRSTFLSLVTKTYPHRTETQLEPFLPKGLKRDEIGNYYTIIGKNPETMFACHLDTVGGAQTATKLFSNEEDGDEIITTDGTTILGGDDKAGVGILMYMMANNVPGLYLFFLGEEVGCVGSSNLARIFNKVEYLANIKRVISFDRKNYHSVITKQANSDCCSAEFATALCAEFNKNGMDMRPDPTGVYTDSACFTDDVSECTNISVGYFNEHRNIESQNISFLTRLAEAASKVDWSSLPSVRKAGVDKDILKKYSDLISAVRDIDHGVEIKISSGKRGGAFIKLNFDYCGIDDIYKTLKELSAILDKHKVYGMPEFDSHGIKVELPTTTYTTYGRGGMYAW
jgi:hypothetical protein